MLLPTLRQIILSVARMVNPNIINATNDQKWYQVHVHSVDLEQYGRKLEMMELIQREIEVGANSVQLAWTPRWLLSPIAMEAILADPEKRMNSVKIMEMSTEDKDMVIKKGIWFEGKNH